MRVVLSLTTIPNRIYLIKKVILSILNQSVHFDALYFNVPEMSLKNIPYKIPLFIKNINDERFILNRCIDYGPITKLIPTLEKETDPDTIIIICDDDQIWAKNTLELFLIKQKEFPNDALSLSGFCIGKFPFLFQIDCKSETDPLVDWIQGTTGILIKRCMLNTEKLKDYSKVQINERILRRNDDHWINYHLHCNHINRRKIAGDSEKYFSDGDIRRVDAISGRVGIFQLEILYICLSLNIYNKTLPIHFNTTKYGFVIAFVIIIFLIAILNKIISLKK